ncbi:MAG: hypothetical protein ACRDQZ_10270, partial [Mycobacteriales bacterium]
MPAHNQLVSFNGIPPATSYVTSVADTSVVCSPEVLFPDQPALQGLQGDCYSLSWMCDDGTAPVGVLAINRFADFPQVRELPHPALSMGACANTHACEFAEDLEATDAQELAAFVIDPRICAADDQAQLSYHWTIHFPPDLNNGGIYAPQGITGYHDATLRIAAQSMPALDGRSDPYWRLTLDITLNVASDFPMTPEPITTSHNFRFR